MNTVASTTPLEFQEFSTAMLDNERKKLNASIAANNPETAASVKIRETLARQIREVPEPAKARLSYETLFINKGLPDYQLLKDHLIRVCFAPFIRHSLWAMRCQSLFINLIRYLCRKENLQMMLSLDL